MLQVGPLGQFATAIQLLGTAAYTRADFADYDRGAFLKASAASAVASSGVLVALLILGFALFWIATAWYILIEALLMRKLSFSLTWWSMIFPMGKQCLYVVCSPRELLTTPLSGVFTTALLNLSIEMDSPAFRVLTTALLLLLLVIYFLNLVLTTYKSLTGSLLGVSQHVKKEKADSGENNV